MYKMEVPTPIPGHSTYGATRDGRIWDLRTETELLNQNSSDSYYRVYLRNKDGLKLYSVHRLIAQTFIPNLENKPEVDHIDRNKTNNDVSNLRWVSREEQCLNKSGWGILPKCIYLEHPAAHQAYECFRVQIRNNALNFSKRFRVSKYSLDDVVKFRNELFIKHGIAITD